MWQGKKKTPTNCSYFVYFVHLTALGLFPYYNYSACSKIRVPGWHGPRARRLDGACTGSGTSGWAGLCPQIKHNCSGGGGEEFHVWIAVTWETFASRAVCRSLFPPPLLTWSTGKTTWMCVGGVLFKSLPLLLIFLKERFISDVWNCNKPTNLYCCFFHDCVFNWCIC